MVNREWRVFAVRFTWYVLGLISELVVRDMYYVVRFLSSGLRMT
jgi:hypothetical protein